jgi:hypothetical protein
MVGPGTEWRSIVTPSSAELLHVPLEPPPRSNIGLDRPPLEAQSVIAADGHLLGNIASESIVLLEHGVEACIANRLD